MAKRKVLERLEACKVLHNCKFQIMPIFIVRFF